MAKKRIMAKRGEIENKLLNKLMSRQELAEKMNIHRSSIDSFMSQTNGMTPRNAKKMLEILKCKFDDIFQIVG